MPAKPEISGRVVTSRSDAEKAEGMDLLVRALAKTVGTQRAVIVEKVGGPDDLSHFLALVSEAVSGRSWHLVHLVDDDVVHLWCEEMTLEEVLRDSIQQEGQVH